MGGVGVRRKWKDEMILSLFFIGNKKIFKERYNFFPPSFSLSLTSTTTPLHLLHAKKSFLNNYIRMEGGNRTGKKTFFPRKNEIHRINSSEKEKKRCLEILHILFFPSFPPPLLEG